MTFNMKKTAFSEKCHQGLAYTKKLFIAHLNNNTCRWGENSADIQQTVCDDIVKI